MKRSAAVRTIEAPTMIVWGDHNQFLPGDVAFTLYRWLLNAQLAVIPNADQFVSPTYQGEFGRFVTTFLNTLLQAESQ